MDADRVFAGAIWKIQSRRSQIDRRRTRLDQERQRLLDKQLELRGRNEKGVAIGALGNLEARRIRSELQDLKKKYTRLNHEEADLRGEERDIDLQLGACPAGHTPSSSRETRVEEHTGEVSSSELEHTSIDLSQFEALSLISTPPTLQSADRVEEHSTEVRSCEPGGTSADLSKVEGISLNVTSPAYESTDGAVVHASDIDSCALHPTNAKQPAVQEALSPRSDDTFWREIDEYLAEHTFTDVWEALVAVKNGFCDPPKKVSGKQSSEKLALPDSPESPHRLDAQSFQTKIQGGESTEQITKNGKLWMEKQVMKAFKKCFIVREGLRGVEFELDELLHQCFSVETYDKIFHHYNFTVKMKKAGSDKWESSTLYFAQVKEMYGQKFYFCYPLDPNEDGICYACKNQGMNALQHPTVSIGYETGRPVAGCPFVDDDSDDGGVKDNDAFVRAFEQVFCNGRCV